VVMMATNLLTIMIIMDHFDDTETGIDINPRKNMSIFGTQKRTLIDIAFRLHKVNFRAQWAPVMCPLNGATHVTLFKNFPVSILRIHRITNCVIDMYLGIV